MGRSGYSDDCDNIELYRAAVHRAMDGRRGQKALRNLLVALDAMSIKELGSGTFQRATCPCSLGVLARHLNLDVDDLEPTEHGPDDYGEVDRDTVGQRFDIAPSMAAEVMFMNDEASYGVESPEERWTRMRGWVVNNLQDAP